MPTRSDFLDSSLDFGGQPTSGGMSNPFAGLLSGGGGGARPAPSAAPAAAMAPSAPSYNGFFDPQAGGARGFIGALMGNPTRQEFQQQRAGSARAAGFKSLSDAIQAGVPPQKAILQFVETPEGQNFFATSADPAGELAQYMQHAVGKPKEDYTLGGSRFSGADNSVIATAPEQESEAVRTFKGMSQLAGLSDEERSVLAKAKLAQGEGDATQSEAAMQRLVASGQIDPLTAQKWLAGVISIVPVKDKDGAVIGQQVFDASTNQMINLGQPNIQQPTALDEPKVDPNAIEEGTPLRRLKELGLNPADVVDGAGPVASFAEKIGGIAGNFPGMEGLSGGQNAIKRQGLNTIAADAGTLLDIYSKNNRASKQDSDNIKTIIGSITGLTTNPRQAAEKLIMFNDYLDTRDKIATEDAGNASLTPTQRGDALAEQSAIRRAKANLPDRDALKAKLAALKTAPTPVEAALPDVKAGVGIVEEEVGGAPAKVPVPEEMPTGKVKKDAKGQDYSFEDKDSLRKALQSGTVKPGDTVLWNGKPTVLRLKGGKK